MKLWHPNRVQWCVIVAVYIVDLLVSVKWTSSTTQTRKPTADEVIQVGQRLLQLTAALRETTDTFEKFKIEREISSLPTNRSDYIELSEQFDPSIPMERFLIFLVVGGALVVWHLQGRA